MQQRRRTTRAAIVLALCLTLAACATVNVGKPWNEWTPKEKAVYFMRIYNTQYADTMALAKTGTLTEAQKKVVRAKKELLTQVRPLLIIYSGTVEAGGIPPADTEREILALINQLTAQMTE